MSEEFETGEVIDINKGVNLSPSKIVEVDNEKGEVTELSEEQVNARVNKLNEKAEELTISEKIYYMAQTLGLNILPPKPTCRTCHGKGYTGMNNVTQLPVLCHCVIPPATNEVEQAARQQIYMGRSERRKYERSQRKKLRKKGK